MPQAGWDPMKELASVRERMNRLFESALARANFDADGGVGAWTPLADVFETADSLVLVLELPGLERDLIDLRMEGDELLVQGEREMDREDAGEQFHRVERSYGKFARRFSIPSAVDRESAKADLKDGVLKITFPMRGGGSRGPIRVDID